MFIKEICRHPCVMKEDACSRKHFVQLKTINMIVRKKILSLRLSSAYNVFGYKKYICKQFYEEQVLIHNGHMQHMQRLCLCKLSQLLEDAIKYGLDTFFNFRCCLLRKHILLTMHRFISAQKYLSRGMVNAKQPTVELGHKQCLNMTLSSVRSCMGTAFEGVD